MFAAGRGDLWALLFTSATNYNFISLTTAIMMLLKDVMYKTTLFPRNEDALGGQFGSLMCLRVLFGDSQLRLTLSQNSTWLPVDDETGFSNSYHPSCHLNPDAAFAWKDLEKSGNRSPKAWFIVINALMRAAHTISHHQLYYNTCLRSQPDQKTHYLDPSMPDEVQPLQSQLDILANALCCFRVALPTSLAFQGKFLSFSASDLPGRSNTLQEDSAKHSIHIMTQLSRFMLYHRQAFSSSWRGEINGANAVDRGSWNCYLNAAQELVSIVRNSSPNHVQHVNPFLSNTVWLAATAQIVSRLFGPPRNHPRLAESNLDLLQKNIDAYISFWGVSKTLQQKLKAIETKLESFLGQETNVQRPSNSSISH